jgi:hypothetical protein
VRPGATVDERAAALMLWQSLIHDINALRGALGEPEKVLSSSVWNEGLAQHSLTQFPRGVRVSMSWVSLPGVKHYEERLRFVSPNLRATLIFPSPYIRHAPTKYEDERMDGEPGGGGPPGELRRASAPKFITSATAQAAGARDHRR